jgi:hypothetical protein
MNGFNMLVVWLNFCSCCLPAVVIKEGVDLGSRGWLLPIGRIVSWIHCHKYQEYDLYLFFLEDNKILFDQLL